MKTFVVIDRDSQFYSRPHEFSLFLVNDLWLTREEAEKFVRLFSTAARPLYMVDLAGLIRESLA